jgi:hypothetical protein
LSTMAAASLQALRTASNAHRVLDALAEAAQAR